MKSLGISVSREAVLGVKKMLQVLTFGHSSFQKNVPSTAQPSFPFLFLDVFSAAFLV